MYSKVELITPERARELLKHNHELNRSVRNAWVETLAKEMKTGHWEVTPQGISISKDGVLLDGQHRLRAIVKANIPVKMYITYDVESDITMFDDGIKRSPKDRYNIRGFSASNSECGAMNFLFAYETNTLNHMKRFPDFCGNSFLKENLETLHNASKCVRVGSSTNNQYLRCSPAIAGLWSAYVWGIPEDKIKRFCEIVNTGFAESPKEFAAVTFKNVVQSCVGLQPRVRNEMIFKSIQEAVKAFVNGEERKKGMDISQSLLL